MTQQPSVDGELDVPSQVFEKFLQNLSAAGMSADLVARFRKTLLEDKLFTERALTMAIVGEEPLL